MTIQDAIKKAIDGGYKKKEINQCTIWFIHENAFDGKRDCFVIDNSYTDQHGERHKKAIHYAKEIVFLDPLFWQCLGKAMGWGKLISGIWIGDWRKHWHDFIDHLAEGKSAEQFFKEKEK